MSANQQSAYERQPLTTPNQVPSPRSASSDLKIKYSGVGVSVDNIQFVYRVVKFCGRGFFLRLQFRQIRDDGDIEELIGNT